LNDRDYCRRIKRIYNNPGFQFRRFHFRFHFPGLPVSPAGRRSHPFAHLGLLTCHSYGGDDITEYLDFDTKGREVTIEQRLNHTSGIKGYTEMPSFGEYAFFEYPRDTLLRAIEQEETWR